jgi:hypothetical protein
VAKQLVTFGMRRKVLVLESTKAQKAEIGQQGVEVSIGKSQHAIADLRFCGDMMHG